MKLIYPTLRDPRLFLVLFLLAYVGYALTSKTFTRVPEQLLASMLVCVLLDTAILVFYKKIFLIPLSGFITSLGIFLLVNSPVIWPYALVAALSILSKHFVRVDNMHIFNPNNFGLVFCLLFFQHDISVEVASWGGHIWLAVLIFCLGSIVVYRVGRVVLVSTFVLSFVVFAVFRSFYSGLPLETLLIPVSGAAFHLFVFYMVTDPKTTPESKKYQVVFAVVLALVDAIFRMNGQKYAPFYSLFIICPLFFAFRNCFQNSGRQFQWKLKSR